MADAGPRTVWNSPIWYAQLGKPWVPLGSLLYGSTQDPPLLPEWLDCCRATPEHSKSPRSRRRKKMDKAVCQTQPLHASASPLPLGDWVWTCCPLPVPCSPRGPSHTGAGQGPKVGRRTPERPQHTLLAQQQCSKRRGGRASHQSGCREPPVNPDPGSWICHSPALKVAPDGKEGKSTSAPQGILCFPSSQIGSLFTL